MSRKREMQRRGSSRSAWGDGSIASYHGWRLSELSVSNVHLPNPQRLPEGKKPYMTNSFVKTPIFPQKRSEGNSLLTCTLGLTSPLFAQAGLIYFAL